MSYTKSIQHLPPDPQQPRSQMRAVWAPSRCPVLAWMQQQRQGRRQQQGCRWQQCGDVGS
eukprot:402611-Pelagomonas_calceolata.AAC.3